MCLCSLNVISAFKGQMIQCECLCAGNGVSVQENGEKEKLASLPSSSLKVWFISLWLFWNVYVFLIYTIFLFYLFITFLILFLFKSITEIHQNGSNAKQGKYLCLFHCVIVIIKVVLNPKLNLWNCNVCATNRRR